MLQSACGQATQGTITPFTGFDPEADCKKLYSAMKGLGKALVQQLKCYNNLKCSDVRVIFVPILKFYNVCCLALCQSELLH